jgi:hypothetical protein
MPSKGIMNSFYYLRLLKLCHTAVWLVMASASFYVLYAGIWKVSGPWPWTCVVLLSLESLVLASNGWVCPLTPLAAKYTDDRSENFDIYLPLPLARYNKQIFGGIFLVGLLLLLRNAFLAS